MLFRVGRTLAVVACVSASAVELAVAADIPYVRSPPPVDVPASWAGFYLGGQVGYGGDSVRWRNLGASAYFSPLNSRTRDSGSGVIGGGQLGYNFQYNRLVFGIEASGSAADFDRSFASPYFPATDVWSSKLTETSIRDNAFGVLAQGSAVHTGWTVGGGVEVKLTRRISLGLEFMHTDLGRGNDINGSVAAGFVPATPENYGVGLRSDSITAWLNYLFGQ